MDRGAVGKKAFAFMFDRFDETGRQVTAAQENAQAAAIGFRRDMITKFHRQAPFTHTYTFAL